MKQKLLLLIVLILLAGVATGYSEPRADLYLGQFPTAKVTVNNKALNSDPSPFIVEDGTTVVPLRAIAKEMGGFISYSDGVVRVVKPHVNVTVSQVIKQNSDKEYLIEKPFTTVAKGQTATFSVFVDVDNAPVSDEVTFKLMITDENGAEVAGKTPTVYSTLRNGTSFMTTYVVPNLTFGTNHSYYSVKFLMKTPYSDYVTVGQNTISIK